MHEDPRSDREWEHWPGRRATADEGIRHRLRALFSATDATDTIEARIEETGREIDEHTDQLQATITDLECRETRARQLRNAVEEMLRLGSAELDERHADLTKLSLDLAEREERVRADERDIAVRKQELGAVELRRAAVERREEVATEREAALERQAADLTERERDVESSSGGSAAGVVSLPVSQAAPFDGTVILLSDAGYRMAERTGPPPPPGDSIEVEGSTFVVVRTGRSPLPGDRRCWVYADAQPL